MAKDERNQRHQDDSWTTERNDETGQLEIVRPRTPRQERRHERAMERWAQRAYDRP